MVNLTVTLLVVLLNIYFLVHSAEVERKTDENGIQLSSQRSPSNKYFRTTFTKSLALKVPSKIPRPEISLQSISPNLFIRLVAGTSTAGYSGDNGPATSAQLLAGLPWVDNSGNVYIPDRNNHRIRKVNLAGIITTFGGTGTQSYTGINGPISSVSFNNPTSVVGDTAGTVLFISDDYYVWMYVFSTNIVSIYAQSPTLGQGLSGDEGPATSARLNNPTGLWLTSAGVLYIADYFNHRIRKVSSGIITTVAGSGCTNNCISSCSGDNGPATLATLYLPLGIYVDSLGKLFIADTHNLRIRLVDTNNIITTFAGTGTPTPFNGDNIPVLSANINTPSDVKGDSLGNIYIADRYNCIIRMVDATAIISTVFGTPGSCGFSSGISSRSSVINGATLSGIWLDSLSNIYFSDYNSIHRSLTVSSPTSQPSQQPTTKPTVRISSSLKTGLVAYYPFDGNAHDNSGNSNHGIIYGNAHLVFDRFGHKNSAFSITGGSITIPHSQSLNLPNNMTLSFWIKLGDNVATPWVDPIYVANSWRFEQHNTDHNYYFAYNTLSGSQAYTTTYTVDIQKWTHIVLWKQDYHMNAFINLHNTMAMNTNDEHPENFGFIKPSSSPLIIQFNGTIDDFFVFNRSLTMEEISALYQFDVPTSQPSMQPTTQPTRQPTSPSSQPTTHPTVRISSTLKNGLIAYYPFDGNAIDSSGNGNNGVVHGGVNLVNDRFGNAKSAMNFNMFTNGYIEVPGSMLNFNDEFTISFWMFPAVIQNGGYSFVFDKSYQVGGWSIYSEFGVSTLAFLGTKFFTYVPNEWSHWVFRKRSSLYSVFKNNVVQSYSNSGAIPSNGAYPLLIGALNLGKTMPASNVGNFFNGILDDIFFYNRSLSDNEITELYDFSSPTSQPSSQPSRQPTVQPTAQPYSSPSSQPTVQPTVHIDSRSLRYGLVAFFPFDGNANDKSGNGYNGIIHGGLSLTADRLGEANSAYLFDGNSGYIELPGMPFDFTTKGDLSISVWIYLFNFGNTGATVFDKSSWSSSQSQTVSGYGFQQTGTNNLNEFQQTDLNQFSFYFVPISNRIQTAAPQLFPTDTWQHFVVTKTGTQINYYLNGMLHTTSTLNPFNILPSANLPLLIGAQNMGRTSPASNVQNYFTGYLDDVFIYNRSLSINEITLLFGFLSPTSQPTTAPSRRPSSQPSSLPTTQPSSQPTVRVNKSLKQSLFCYFPFSGNSNDKSGNNQNGAVHGGVSLVSDRFGNAKNAVELNGKSGYLTVSSPRHLFTNLTVSFWINPNNQFLISNTLLLDKYLERSNRNGTCLWYVKYLENNIYEFVFLISPESSRRRLHEISSKAVSVELSANVWSHVAFVVNRNSINCYKNGQLNNSFVVDLSSESPLEFSNLPLIIGTSARVLNELTNVSYFSGSLDDIFIYDRALSSNEISQLYGFDSPTSFPTAQPSSRPSSQPSSEPTGRPSSQPMTIPTSQPSCNPSAQPTAFPSSQPTRVPTSQPSVFPTNQPISSPSSQPTSKPTSLPSSAPSMKPSKQPTSQPTSLPSTQPTEQPSTIPSGQPTRQPSTLPTNRPSEFPTGQPSQQPFAIPSSRPSSQPVASPSFYPTSQPSIQPSAQPTTNPSTLPSAQPVALPSSQPTSQPTVQPSGQPSGKPSSFPSSKPTIYRIHCTNNRFYSFFENRCIACPLNSFLNQTGDDSCLCIAGFAQSGFGLALNCTMCPLGEVSLAGAQNCTKCPLGLYAMATTSTCELCPIGFYSNSLGQSQCHVCPAGRTTGTLGSIASSQCISPVPNFTLGFFALFIVVGVFSWYIVFGKFHRVSFERRVNTVIPNIEKCKQVLIYEEELHYRHLIDVQEKRDRQNKKYKFISFALISFLLVIVSVIASFIYFTYQVFFTSLILWRGMKVDFQLSPILNLFAEALEV
jgi:hypothetical protein